MNVFHWLYCFTCFTCFKLFYELIFFSIIYLLHFVLICLIHLICFSICIFKSAPFFSLWNTNKWIFEEVFYTMNVIEDWAVTYIPALLKPYNSFVRETHQN